MTGVYVTMVSSLEMVGLCGSKVPLLAAVVDQTPLACNLAALESLEVAPPQALSSRLGCDRGYSPLVAYILEECGARSRRCTTSSSGSAMPKIW